jgi:GNAT superfamily N-acetyltransferase
MTDRTRDGLSERTGPAAGPQDDIAATALRRAYLLFASRIVGGSTSVDDSGVRSFVIPVPKSRMNGLLLPQAPVDAVRLRHLAAPFVGRPWSMSVIDGETAAVAEVAAELHLNRTVLPSLTAPLLPALEPEPEHGSETVVRVTSDEERLRWATTCDVAFGSPPGLSARLLTEELAAAPEVRAYLTLRDGRPVATALTVLDDRGWLGLYTVGTVPSARRNGVGERLVRFVLEDGARSGGHSAYLQSSETARPLYQRIGFRDDLHPIVSFES